VVTASIRDVRAQRVVDLRQRGVHGVRGGEVLAADLRPVALPMPLEAPVITTIDPARSRLTDVTYPSASTGNRGKTRGASDHAG
jgi:hypothetical protein